MFSSFYQGHLFSRLNYDTVASQALSICLLQDSQFGHNSPGTTVNGTKAPSSGTTQFLTFQFD